MAARFVATPEKIEEINRLYYQIGVKAEVARQIGCSPATVSKYLINGYRPPEKMPEIDVNELAEPTGPFNLIRDMCSADSRAEAFCKACILSEDEWYGMMDIQEKYVTI